MSRSVPPTLPAQPSRLIGREEVAAAVRELLLREEVRLVTITGAAGIGKTRLAIAVGSNLSSYFADGAVLVDLAPLTDPSRVMVAIARELGLLNVTEQAALERVIETLRPGSQLLVLDNFEHVLAAASGLATLLGGTEQLKVLITSRAPLRLRWEHVFHVPPLETPDLAAPPSLEDLTHVPSVALFLERANAAGAELRLDTSNARAVAQLCVRLDGLPLALELAATQMRFISPDALLARMDHQLDLLAGGAQDQPARHRTLRDAINWSYRLLPDDEQSLFRRVGVFVGGISLEAARAVGCAGSDEAALLASLGSIADQNLLRREAPVDEPRFDMLETIREFARERLAATDELADARRAYATYWCDFAERADAELHGPAQVVWLNRLELEQANLNAPLTWCERADEVELGVRLAAALGWFWYLRGGDRSEGKHWLDRMSARAESVPSATTARARALSAAGLIAQYQLDPASAVKLQQTALALARSAFDASTCAVALARMAHAHLFRLELEQGDAAARDSYTMFSALQDRWGMAYALSMRGLIARSQNRGDEARVLLMASLDLFRESGDRWGIAHASLGLGQLALRAGDLDLAKHYWSRRLELARELGSHPAIAHTLDLVASLERDRGDHAAAEAQFEEALSIRRRVGDHQATAWTLQAIGELNLDRGDIRQAYARLSEALNLRSQIADRHGMVSSLEAFARVAALLRLPRRAVRLAGAAAALYAAVGPIVGTQPYTTGFSPNVSPRVSPISEAPAHPDVERVARRLGPDQRRAAFEEGKTLPLDGAVNEAFSLESQIPGPGESRQLPIALTRREREIAALLAQGLTNRQIAAELVITEGSAHVQVVRLLSKLGLHSRAQVAPWLLAHGQPLT